MNLYLVGNVVLYDDRKWEITSFGTDGKGHTTVNLARGEFRVSVLESEVEIFLELSLDEFRLTFRVHRNVTVHDFITRQLEKQDGTLVPVLLGIRSVDPGLQLLCKFRVLFHKLFT